MNMISELQNDLALAFLVEKKYSEILDANGAKAIMDNVAEVLLPASDEERIHEASLAAGKGDSMTH